MSQLLEPEPTVVASAPVLPAAAIYEGRPATVAAATDDSLFDRLAWLYVFFRERIFRDDTERMIRTLWPTGDPPAQTNVLELGCGPGFYSCQLAERFPQIEVCGVDRSARQVQCAKQKAQMLALSNCQFRADNVLALSHPDESFDALVAGRLFTVLPDPEQAISEMHRVLRPGGRCFIAEPRYAVWASLPLLAMWILAGLTRMNNGCREPRRARVLSSEAFRQLFATQPWRSFRTWNDGRYQYALCEKN